MNQELRTPQQQQQQSLQVFQDVPVESLEQLRMRLSQLTHSLNKLQTDMVQSTTLPQWSSLQNQLGVILSQLTSLASTIDKHIEKLSRTDVFPLNSFPTSQQEGLLTTLLRKKHLPEISNWINESLNMVEGLDLQKDDKWCGWCLDTIELEIAEFVFSGFLTKKELESGVEEQQQINTEDDKSGYSVDQIYKYIYQGIDPRK